MIVLGIGLSVLLIAFLFIQVYPFHEQKLEQRKYDEYGSLFIQGYASMYRINFYKKTRGNGD
ncbi:Uncharacterized protein BC141101_05637 [Bacillus toyonensis]|nr:Uncharacterized protein BC141101_05637 [Bacillus toyonensis]